MSLARMAAWLRRGGQSGASARVQAPLITPDELAALAGQAGLLATPQVREVHDHHAGDWASRWLGRGLDFEESRLYSPGDDIRDMDWRTTARTGRAHLKIYREERQPTLHLVIDRGPAMCFGTRRRLKLAQAARVAALLALATAARNGVMGATLWDVQDVSLPARHGRLAALHLIGLAAAPSPPRADPAPTEFLHHTDRLARLDAELPRGARVVLISDFAWLAEAHVNPLARLAARCDVWAIQIVDPAERALPDLGAAHFHDMASGQQVWIDTGAAAVRGAVQRALADRLAAQARILACAGARHQQIDSTADDLVTQLVHA